MYRLYCGAVTGGLGLVYMKFITLQHVPDLIEGIRDEDHLDPCDFEYF